MDASQQNRQEPVIPVSKDQAVGVRDWVLNPPPLPRQEDRHDVRNSAYRAASFNPLQR